MSRITFKTGKSHQECAAVWARKRLVDSGGRRFTHDGDQDGVLLADCVGLGKTWEALASAALVLYKLRRKVHPWHILVLCPANLVTKWEDELSAGSPFRRRLADWLHRVERTGDAASARRVAESLAEVLPIRRSAHVATRLNRGRFHPPAGTYIVSQSLITGRGHGLSALRREQWDLVIVDEAHSAIATRALKALSLVRKHSRKILLTATPFQLEPRQLNGMVQNILIRPQKILNRPELAGYIDQVADVFENPNNAGPLPQATKEAAQTLRKLATRQVLKRANRVYAALRLDGQLTRLGARLDELDDESMREILVSLQAAGETTRLRDFETEYFKNRLKLSAAEKRTYVATRLRRLLSTGVGGHESPRRLALAAWAERAFRNDIEVALRHGRPRKTIVFTSWVGHAHHGEAAGLQERLQEAFQKAVAAVRKRNGQQWSHFYSEGKRRLERAGTGCNETVSTALRQLGDDEVTAVLAGKHRGFMHVAVRGIQERLASIDELRERLSGIEDRGSFEARAIRRRIRDAQRTMGGPADGRPPASVERYTGNERRSTRDRSASAFRDLGAPWVLVASNVGSEGIDLHTYTARIVHYDLEWNPAKMEQREGRGDRVGRRLRDALEIVYCLVPRTYDERMFHQLVARDRWHGVLLGKPALRLDDDAHDAPIVIRKRLERMRLDLAPRI